jgi:hypothetical protein
MPCCSSPFRPSHRPGRLLVWLCTLTLGAGPAGCSLPSPRTHVLEAPQPHEQWSARWRAWRHRPPFDPQTLLAALEPRAGAIAGCLALADEVERAEVGMLVRFRADPDGTVHVEQTTPAPAEADAVEHCMHQALEGLRVAPFSGHPERLDVPFVYARKS